MFESLTDKLELTFKRLRGQGKITEKNIDDALREVRLALLEADVHIKVVKSFPRLRQGEIAGSGSAAKPHAGAAIHQDRARRAGRLCLAATITSSI